MQLAFDLPARPAMEREDFLVAPCNHDAVEWIDRWPAWPYPALVLHGPARSGKTHLARVWQKRAGAFWATRADAPDCLAAAGAGQGICLDIDGTIEDETALFHLFNWTREHGGSLLITGNAPPRDWGVTLPDLRSRLQAAPTAMLAEPDDALLAAVTVKLFSDRQLAVAPDLLNYILQRTDRSFAALGDAVDRLDKAALQEKRRITPRFAKQVLGY
ncbi:DnaA/Hda family protein [Iodidimonas sp. SYSU 1G8]|uniref:HdaA/DnaA family protein n=1 Tax=Iodidimonas sp. SYSU 1G8 TaxID=3133967 RepID=UPI0031FEA0B1